MESIVIADYVIATFYNNSSPDPKANASMILPSILVTNPSCLTFVYALKGNLLVKSLKNFSILETHLVLEVFDGGPVFHKAYVDLDIQGE